jgi:ankyrin repeat protein
VELLIGARANVNVMDGCRGTALTMASAAGDVPIVEKLLTAGADMEAGSLRPLCTAVARGQLQVVELLLSRKARVNYDGQETSPLMLAALHGNAIAMSTLRKAGADVNGSGARGETALLWAAGDGNYHVVRSLVWGKASINAQDAYGTTPLMNAAAAGAADVAEFLIRSDADIHLKNRAKKTALSLATTAGHVAIIKLLKDAGAKNE